MNMPFKPDAGINSMSRADIRKQIGFLGASVIDYAGSPTADERAEELLDKAMALLNALSADPVIGVVVQGGLVQEIITPKGSGAKVVVIDYDVEGVDPESDELIPVRQLDPSGALSDREVLADVQVHEGCQTDGAAKQLADVLARMEQR